jgi:hypothetical protein
VRFSQQLFSIKLSPEYEDPNALPLLISTVKPIQIAHNEFSSTFLPVRAQGGGYCGSFFLVSSELGVGISGVDGAGPKCIISRHESVDRLDLGPSVYGGLAG